MFKAYIQRHKEVGRLLVTNAEAGAVGEHAGRNVHGEKFLEQKLGGIWNVDLGDARLVVAGTAFVVALFDRAATH